MSGPTGAERPTSTTADPAAAVPAAARVEVREGDSDELTAEELSALESYSRNEIPSEKPVTTTEVNRETGQETEVRRTAPPADDDEIEHTAADGKKAKYVPHQALHAERDKHKSTKAELAAERESRARLQAILDSLADSKLTPAQAPVKKAGESENDPFAEPDINPNVDLLGAIQQQQRRQKAMNATQLRETQSRAAAQQVQTVTSAYEADAARVRQADPTFDDAYRHWEAQTVARYEALGVTGSNLVKAVQLEELGIVQTAISQRRSPAETILALAKAGGFQPAAKPNGKGNGAAAPAATAAAAPDPQALATISAIARGQQATASLGDLSGEAGPTGMTPQALAALPQHEFEAYVNKLEREGKEEQLSRLLGKR